MYSKRQHPQISDADQVAIAVLIARQVMAKAAKNVSGEVDAELALAILTTDLSRTHGMTVAFESVAEVRRVLTTFCSMPDPNLPGQISRLH